MAQIQNDLKKDLIKAQFGRNANNYVISKSHSQGESLERLVLLTNPHKDWNVLDVATGTGHTAFRFSAHSDNVTGVDITPQMIRSAQQQAVERNLKPIFWVMADAQFLPFPTKHFDLITCRIAPHHFEHISSFLQEALRLLRNKGILAIVDTIVPDDAAAAKYINKFEEIRDPSHHQCLSAKDWRSEIITNGFVLEHFENNRLKLNFEDWANRMSVTQETYKYLKKLLLAAEGDAKSHFAIELHDTKILFCLLEGVFIVTPGQR